jgi:hypothetical protein
VAIDARRGVRVESLVRSRSHGKARAKYLEVSRRGRCEKKSLVLTCGCGVSACCGTWASASLPKQLSFLGWCGRERSECE